MKTKRFYSYLIAACCCMTMVSLTSCDEKITDDFDFDEKYVEYIEFKEPCLINHATPTEVHAWMKANMPEWELSYSWKAVKDDDKVLSYDYGSDIYQNIAYFFDEEGLCNLYMDGNFHIKDVLMVLDEKYGKKTPVNLITNPGLKGEAYKYLDPKGDLEYISCDRTYGKSMDNEYTDGVFIIYYFRNMPEYYK